MKEITKVYTVYNIEELTEAAQEKARSNWAESIIYDFMSDCMNEKLHELLQEHRVVDTNDTSKPGTKPTEVFYSLSHNQGDGAMFEGVFTFTYKKKKYTAKVKHSGHYYHSNSKDVTIVDSKGEETDAKGYTWWAAAEHFEKIYQKICKDLEVYGYGFMEYEDSLENFKETCEANKYTFTIDGIMDNN